MSTNLWKFPVAFVSGCGRQFARECVFWGGMLGWWSFFWRGAPHLTPSPPLFLLVSFSFVFGVLCLVCFCLFVCCFENNFQCLPFFLPSLPFLSLSIYLYICIYIYMYISLFLSSSFLFFFLSCVIYFFLLLYCFGVCLSCLISWLLFHVLNFGGCLSYLVSLLLFHEMNNFKILNLAGFNHKSFLFFGFQRATSPGP